MKIQVANIYGLYIDLFFFLSTTTIQEVFIGIEAGFTKNMDIYNLMGVDSHENKTIRYIHLYKYRNNLNS